MKNPSFVGNVSVKDAYTLIKLREMLFRRTLSRATDFAIQNNVGAKISLYVGNSPAHMEFLVTDGGMLCALFDQMWRNSCGEEWFTPDEDILLAPTLDFSESDYNLETFKEFYYILLQRDLPTSTIERLVASATDELAKRKTVAMAVSSGGLLHEAALKIYEAETGKTGTLDEAMGWYLATTSAALNDAERKAKVEKFLSYLPAAQHDAALTWLAKVQQEGLKGFSL
jgi:hypothetical protein